MYWKSSQVKSGFASRTKAAIPAARGEDAEAETIKRRNLRAYFQQIELYRHQQHLELD